MTPKVTVLLAVYDGEPFLRRCVDSVLGQTYEDFELLVVDDASTDATPEILASYGDPRVRVLRNERNLGQVPSLNRGLGEARGEYVARIDADDWCRPERLERQLAVLDAEPTVGLVGTWMDLVDERGRPVARLRSTIADVAEFVFHTLIMRVLISHPAAMYRRQPVAALTYDESTAPAEDKDLWRRLLLEGWRARIVPEPLVVYQLHDAQLSQTQAERQRRVDGESQERFLAQLRPGAEVHGLRLLLANDPALWTEPRLPDSASLHALLASAAERLGLAPADAERVRRLVVGHVLGVVRARPWRADARRLAAELVRQLPPDRRREAVLRNGAAYLLGPARLAAQRATSGVSALSERTPLLRALHAPVRRSRLARRLYGKLVGSS